MSAPDLSSIPEGGNCFEVVAALLDSGLLDRQGPNDPIVLGDKSPFRICHGTPMHPTGGFRHWHAWLEVTLRSETLCVDLANGNRVAMPQSVYYEAGQLSEEHVYRYTLRDAKAQLRKHEHCGPWERNWQEIAR